ncbi:MAG: Omp28-related outer membrane protein [Bacteroidales bacterium]
MKKILYSLILILPIFWISCDTIEDDQKLVYPKGQTSETTPITVSSSEQKVLLEDYTGWKCVNCPRAAAKATEMITKYGEQLVVMSVHSTAFAIPSTGNNNIDFRTEYGEKWATDFGCTSLPTGIINRKKLGASYPISDANWDSEIQNVINSQEHIMDINLGAEYRSEDKQILVSTENVFLKDYPSSMLINIVVLESGIVGVQYNSDPNFGTTPKINDFVFNHVLRKNGLIDYSLSLEGVAKDTKINKNYLIDVDPDIQDISKCTIVVFVSDSETKEVIQANEIHL